MKKIFFGLRVVTVVAIVMFFVFAARVNRVQRARKSSRNLPARMTAAWMNEVYVVPERQFIFCLIPKNGCTVWKMILLRIMNNGTTGSVTEASVHEHFRSGRYPKKMAGPRALGNYSLNDREHILRHFERIVVVRHPLARLISGFLDVEHIVVKPFLDASGHAQFTVDAVARGLTQLVAAANMCRRKDHLRRHGVCDRHFAAQSRVCGLDEIDYDHIVHYERSNEVDALLRYLRVSRDALFTPHHARAARNSTLLRDVVNNATVMELVRTMYDEDYRRLHYDDAV